MSNQLGVEIPLSTLIPILIVFAIYTVLVIGIALYVNRKAKKGTASDKVSSFFTGGGISALGIGMIFLTNNVAAGTFIGGPGTGYAAGFIWTICVFAFFFFALYVMGAVNKKMTIVKNRIHASSLIEIWRHRYQSKPLAVVLSLSAVVFSIFYAVGQFSGGGKFFAVLTGTNHVTGIVVFAAITLIYTICGGVKSLSRIAVFQGFLILVATLMLYIGTRSAMVEQYGSFEAAMQWVYDSKPSLFLATSFPVLVTVGMCLQFGFGGPSSPYSTMVVLSTNSSQAIRKSAIIATLAATFTCLCISGIGPLAYSLVPTLTSGDYVNPYLTVTVLPSVLGGILVSASAAAIQSTVAAVLITIASALVQDFLKDVVNPKMQAKKVYSLSITTMIVAAVVIMALSLMNTGLIQRFILLSSAGFMASRYMLSVFGLYWKRANAQGAFASCLGGFIAYCVLYVWENYAAESYRAVFGTFPSMITAVLVSLALMVAVSLATKQTPKGIIRVWFSRDYDERYAVTNVDLSKGINADQ